MPETSEMHFRDIAIGELASECEEVYISEVRIGMLRFSYLKRWFEYGPRKGASNH